MKTTKQVSFVDSGLIRQQALEQVGNVINVLRDKKLLVGFAESCTGGLLSSLWTKHSGVSDVYLGSVVSYANEVKMLMLGVEPSVFVSHGAVSAECAQQMATGLQTRLKTTLPAHKNVVTVSITGIAGPNGGSNLKPVGTVFMAVAGVNDATQIFHHEFVGHEQKNISREDIQYAAVWAAMKHLESVVTK